MSLCRRFAQIVSRAAEVGYPDPVGLGRCTPVEIEQQLNAFVTGQRAHLEQIDLLAWLIGRYVTIGWHNPARYPRRPDAVRLPRVMTDDEMKRALLAFVEGHA